MQKYALHAVSLTIPISLNVLDGLLKRDKTYLGATNYITMEKCLTSPVCLSNTSFSDRMLGAGGVAYWKSLIDIFAVSCICSGACQEIKYSNVLSCLSV